MIGECLIMASMGSFVSRCVPLKDTRDLVVQLTGNAPASVARTMLQPVLDEARLAARTCTRASLNNDKANGKGKVRMECGAAIHFMRNRGREKIIDACLEQLV